jgi:hypothetical protein
MPLFWCSPELARHRNGNRKRDSQVDLVQNRSLQDTWAMNGFDNGEMIMRSMQTQRGGSAIGLIITLLVLGYGVFVGIQYVPQYIESNTVDTILDSLADQHRKEPFSDTRAINAAIDNQLYINQLGDMKSNFSIRPSRGSYIVTVSYERELNLVYAEKQVLHEKSVTLD